MRLSDHWKPAPTQAYVDKLELQLEEFRSLLYEGATEILNATNDPQNIVRKRMLNAAKQGEQE